MCASAIRARLALLAAGLLFAACGGRAIIPSQSVSANGAFASNVVEHASPCANSMLQWYFHGACKGFTVTSIGGKVALPAYKGVGVSVSIGANTPGGKLAFLAGDATGASDITGKFTFPLYSQATCAPGLTCPGKTKIYVEIANVSTTTTNVTGDISLTVTAKSFPGKHCFPATMGTSVGEWRALVGLANPVKNGKVTATIPGVAKVPLPPGATAYIAVVCQ